MRKFPVFIFIVVFTLSIMLTQFLAYQQYRLLEEKGRSELTHEAAEVKDRFRNILFNDIAAANTLAVIYKQYGVPDNFDSIAHQIIQTSRYAEALQITESGIVKNVYPDIRYKATIGTSVNTDSVRKAEEAQAVERRGIYFAGPRRLRFGDTGILGKVPVVIDNKVVAIITVLTRMTAIKKALVPQATNSNKFAYQLLKIRHKGNSFFLLSDSKPGAKSEYADVVIPEGDWLLRVSYTNKYATGSLPLQLSGLGILFSFIAALLAYKTSQAPYKLKNIIAEKTSQLAKSEKYFRTLIETNSEAIVLMDDNGKVLYQTLSTEKILGYTFAEVQHIDGIELIHPDYREEDGKFFGEILKNPGLTVERKHKIKHKNGKYLEIEGTYRNLLGDENVGAIVLCYKDITEKKLAEQMLKRSMYELSLLNEVNDIILRDLDQASLFSDICECIVRSGIYSMAWISLKPANSDVDQTVSPLASAGNPDYLVNVKIDLNDPKLSNGTTGIALKTGKVFINNNTVDAPFFQLWVDRAKAFEIKSSIALPFNMGDNRLGALTIYSAQTNVFDSYEVSILKRLVDNLSIAIQNIDNRRILVESENRFRSAFEDSAIGMGLTSIMEDSKGKWLKVNKSLCEMLGYTEDELLSRNFMQITHPDDLPNDLAAQERILKGQDDIYRAEKRYLHKDGRIVWVNLNVSIVRDKDRKPMYMAAQVENITEKVESQVKFQKLVETFIVGVYMIQDNKFVYVNPQVIEESGYTEDEIIGMSVDHFIYQEDLKLVHNMMNARIMNDQKTVRYEARIRHKNGTIIWCEILGGASQYKGAPALMGTMVNITERKAMYDELLRSEANLKSMFDTTDVLFLLVNTNYKIIALNQQMKDGYIAAAGIELNEGDNLVEVMHPEKRAGAKAIYDEVIETNQSKNYETTYEKNGVYTHLLANVKPINDGTGVIGICISAIDMTERKKMTLDLLNHVNAIEEQNKKLREIAWMQSHVVRAPLVRIMALVDLFRNQQNTEVDKDMILDYIVASADELDEIIKNISEKVS